MSCAIEGDSPGGRGQHKRYVNSPVMVDAVLAQYEPLLFRGGEPHFQHQRSVRFPGLRNFNLSHSNDVVRST